MRPTLKTVAQMLNLSATTVSRALKNANDISPETIERVKEAAERLGYSPNLRGVNLRTGRTNSLCVVIPMPLPDGLGDLGHINLITGMSSVLRQSSYSLTVVPQPIEEDDMAPIQRIVERQLADGIIFQRSKPQDVRVSYLVEKKFPFVIFGRTEMYSPYAYVDVDHETLIHQTVTRLLSRGHRRIALLNPPPALTYSHHRITGYRRGLADANVPFAPDLVVAGELDGEAGTAATQALLALPEPPTAFISPGELVTLGVLAQLRDAGIVVGRDATVISFDGTPMACFQSPKVTAFFSSLTTIGADLAHFLIRLIEGEDPMTLRRLHQATLIEQGQDALGG
ncbi:MAG: substrate-binding domain-containing protein [Azospirillaceae bacterium]|nr:substrate-binding domain-containing protein [Azospirillaceae bacterium]